MDQNIMKKLLLLGAGLFLFSGCTPEIPAEEDIPAVEFGDAIDLTNIFAQVCETESGPCKNISCTLIEDTYSCYENVSKREEGCSAVKTKDEVISKYKICGLGFSDAGEKLDAEKYSIFNYGQSLELLEMGGTPAEFEQKIEEEVQAVEDGGTSDFLSTMMAVAAGSIIGGMISNALFNSNSAAPPRSAATHKEEPFDKKKLDDSKKSTSENSSKIKDSVSKTQQKSSNTAKKTAAKKAAAQKASQKKTTPKKSSSSSKKRRR